MLQFRHALSAVVLVTIAACASAPEPAIPFAERLATAQAAGNPYEVDAALTELLTDQKLAPADRAEALYRRGSLRRLAGDNRRGSVSDLEAMLALAPDHLRADAARIELELVREDVAGLESRLDYMLNLPQWFDISWALGEREAPARRYQTAGLSPSEDQTQKLKDAGFICGEAGEGGPVQGAGDPHAWLDGLTWCDALPTAAETGPLPAPEPAG